MDDVQLWTIRKVDSHFLCVLMLVLFIFCMSSLIGTLPKALLMSIVARIVRFAGFGAFRPSCMCCVSVVRSIVVECLAVKLC